MSARPTPPSPRNAPAVEAAFEAAPPEVVAEIVDGELHVHPRPARPHARVGSRLGQALAPFDLGDAGGGGPGSPGGWVILDEPELRFGPRPDIVVSDLAGWQRARMPDVLGGEDAPAFFDLAPDWVCEILSPSTEKLDRGKKMRVYRREGVRHAWLINPAQRTLEVYRVDGAGAWTRVDTHEEDAAVRVEPFDAVELPLGRLWER
ncbi:MAG: hypothetical protein NVS3B10_05270 [Polyangiales bacterium]